MTLVAFVALKEVAATRYLVPLPLNKKTVCIAISLVLLESRCIAMSIRRQEFFKSHAGMERARFVVGSPVEGRRSKWKRCLPRPRF